MGDFDVRSFFRRAREDFIPRPRARRLHVDLCNRALLPQELEQLEQRCVRHGGKRLARLAKVSYNTLVRALDGGSVRGSSREALLHAKVPDPPPPTPREIGRRDEQQMADDRKNRKANAWEAIQARAARAKEARNG